jgi:hypothetical protein
MEPDRAVKSGRFTGSRASGCGEGPRGGTRPTDARAASRGGARHFDTTGDDREGFF